MAKHSSSSAASKKQLKEKVVQIYEAFFKGEDPSVGNPNFWHELFLLRVNVAHIESQFDKLTNEELVQLKNTFNSIFYQCIRTLKEDHQIRIVNALQTMCALVRGVFRKAKGDYGFHVINILIGFDTAEYQMQVLIGHLSNFLVGEYPHSLKEMTLKFLLTLVTATENVSQNTMIEYLMMNSVFEAIILVLADPQSRTHHGYSAVLLLTILVNYRKYEAANPYIVKLSIVDNEVALNGYGQVVSASLAEFNRRFTQQNIEHQTGILSAITNMVGSMFLSDESGDVDRKDLRANDAVLLALYEAVHLNRNFITTLTNSQPDNYNVPSFPGSVLKEDAENQVDAGNVHDPPSNLLVTFLEFCSIVIQYTKDEANTSTSKLCFIILTCIAEDQFANSIMHDVNMVFKIHLHRLPMRHRKVSSESGPSRPLACALLDLMVEFVLSHMRKCLLMDLYLQCLGIVHRLLCYQKKCRIRLQYNWKELWTALIGLLKFIIGHECDLVAKYNVFLIAAKVVNIFNLFITYGDTFLPSPQSYDELYYELIRMHQVFDNMYSMTLRYTTSDGSWKDTATKLTSSLVNIRAIINHFNPKIDSWSAVHHLSALTEEQVLEVVRSSYDTLTLKLHDNLDQFERYAEKPKESAFFTQMVRSTVVEYRQKVMTSASSTPEHRNAVLHEFSTIT